MKKYCFLLSAVLACIAAPFKLLDKPPSGNPKGALLTDDTRALSKRGTPALTGEAPGLHTLSAKLDANATAAIPELAADISIDRSLNLNKLTFTGLGI